MIAEALDALIERRLRELLEDEGPECERCGRKPMTPAQRTQALRVALNYVATKGPGANGGPAPGSGFREDEDDRAN